MDVKGNPTAPHVGDMHNRKKADSTKSNPGAKLKESYPTNCSTCAAETPMPVLSKKSFKKLPQWDFEDIYNQDAQPKQTVSML